MSQYNYKLFLITLLIVFILDVIYIIINKKIYTPIFSTNNLKIEYGFFAWLLIAFALTFFILSNETLSIQHKIFNAFILGFCIYGIYNFTNMAILPSYNLQILLVDTLWGGTLFVLVTFIVLYLQDAYKLF